MALLFKCLLHKVENLSSITLSPRRKARHDGADFNCQHWEGLLDLLLSQAQSDIDEVQAQGKSPFQKAGTERLKVIP